MDQGSVVVLCRRGFLWRQILSHPDMDRDLNYSGSIPTATTLIPDPLTVIPIPVANGSGISSGAVPSISTIATYPDSFIALIPDRWTIGECEILPLS